MTTTILYYPNITLATAASGGTIAQTMNTYVIGAAPIGSTGTVVFNSVIYNAVTEWRVAFVNNNTNGLGIYPAPSGVYANGFDFDTLGITNVQTFFLYPATPPCFLEGTKILCKVNDVETYIPVETIRSGTLVKTSRDGYKKVEYIGKGLIHNPGNSERVEQRLYKCSPENYPELTEPIYLTGCHSILVDNITSEQHNKLIEQMERIFVTDNKYRLTALVDERAEPWASEGTYTIWHFALENENKKKNYGVYASGLLVETCCIDRLKNNSTLQII